MEENNIFIKKEEWIKVIIAILFEDCSQFRGEEKISCLLKEYIKQWTEMEVNVGDEIIKVRPPYVMNGDYYKRQKNGYKVWKTYEIEIEDRKKKEVLCYKIGKNTAYFVTMNEHLKPRSKCNYEEWKKIKEQLKKSRLNIQRIDFDYQSLKGEKVGKAHPETIKRYINEKYTGKKTVKGIEGHLKNYAIGIDCSGFVSRAIATVMARAKFNQDDLQNKTLVFSKNNKIIITNAILGYIQKSTKETINKTVLAAGTDYNNEGIKVLKPGDVITKTKGVGYHVAIIYEVGYDKDNEEWYYKTADASPIKSPKRIVDDEKKQADSSTNGVRLIYHTSFKKGDKPFSSSNYKIVRPYAFAQYFKLGRKE